MKIRMLVTKQGSPDGIRVIEYKKGDVVDVPLPLAEVFLENKWAEPVKEKAGKANQDPAQGKGGNPPKS